MSDKVSILSEKRVLVVEDEILVALVIEDFLIEWGCVLGGTYSSMPEALNAVENEVFELAILDLNLSGKMSYPIAEALERRGIPFLFLSGYGEQAILPLAHPTWMVCAKPFSEKRLAEMLLAVLTPSRPPAAPAPVALTGVAWTTV